MGGLDDTALRNWLERVVADRIAGSAAAIASIRMSRFPHIGSYDCERVTVDLRSGEQVELFCKDLTHSRLSKDDPEQRRIRELSVYRDLLDGAELGTPRFYGAVRDEQRGRFWMLLELVEGEIVEEIDAGNGVLAVAWLARLQAHFLSQIEKIERSGFLIEHDGAYFLAKAADATRDVGNLAPDCMPRLERVLDLYERNLELMTEGQPTLVHGGYIPWHILIDRREAPARVCAVDWELAARGSTLYDLAIFIDDAPPLLQDELCAAYREAATEHGVPVPDEDPLQRTLACFRLHRVVDWLSRSAEKAFSPRKIGKLIERAELRRASIEANS